MMVFMSFTFFSKSRGSRNIVSRIFTVFRRFGFSSKRFERLLQKYYEITSEAGCVPTFAITAVVIDRHPDFVKELSRRGVEFAIHGYVHIDYKVLTTEEKLNHFNKAKDIFKKHEIPFVGYRAPFLRANANAAPILSELGFRYNSSRAIYWPVIDINGYSQYARNNHKRLLEFYTPLDSEKYFSLPRLANGLVEIPVSIPDDEMIIERLGIIDQNRIKDIWLQIMHRVHDKGELFTLSLHPERIDYCRNALIELLHQSRDFHPPVWVASLREITAWWQERTGFSFDVLPSGEGKYKVRCNCSDEATVLVKNARVNVPASDWSNGYSIVGEKDFVLESPKRPIIGVSADVSPAALIFLKTEGYIVEEGENPDDYGIYLDNLAQFSEIDEMSLSKKIENSGAPLCRYWRWPNRAKSAISVTGDIDSITVIDFVLRIYENWQQRNRQIR
jgi:peptidoglycan/xylan/chitin deacetylase (PgdA/CDA1 family)